MSWWDPLVSYFGGGDIDLGDAVSQTASGAGQALGGLFSGDSGGSGGYSSMGDGAIQSLGAVGDYSGGVPFDTSSLAGIERASAGAMPVNTTTLAGLDAASMGGSGTNYDGFINGAGTGDSGAAVSGGSDMVGKAVDWAKKNPSLMNTGIQAGLTATRKTSPVAATTAGYNAAAAGNAARTAVGTSMINQAPFMAQNNEAAAKGASANAEGREQQRLQQLGYKPGDAMYDSSMQQLKIGNRGNEATAYASGQGQMANQESTGAGLLTPNLAGYEAMSDEQNAQQGADNKQNAELAGLGKTAFDIWANPDKKTDAVKYQ